MDHYNDAPTEPLELPHITGIGVVECAICRAETGVAVAFGLLDVVGMRSHLRNAHSPAFTLALHFPDPDDEEGGRPSFDFAD